MFATPAIAFHTILSLIAIGTGACVILCMAKGSRPGTSTLAFLIAMVATDVTGFFLPATMLLPSHIVGILSLALIAIALAANYALHFPGAWRAVYAVTMGGDATLPEGRLPASARAGCAGQSPAAIPDRAGDRAGDLHLADLEEREEFPAELDRLARRRGCGIAGVRRAGRLDQQQVHFLARDRAMLHALRYDEHLAGG